MKTFLKIIGILALVMLIPAEYLGYILMILFIVWAFVTFAGNN